MVEAVFHIGAHKCATTSIQAALAALAAKRDDIGYVAPGAPGSAQGEEAVRAFVRLARRGRTSGTARRAVVDGLCRLIERRAGKARIVLSDENMLGAMPGLDWSFYPGADVVRAVLDGVAERFPTFVLLQSREPAALLRSCHQFRVRRGMTMSRLGFLQTFDLASVSWRRLGATLFAGAGFRSHVLPIETLADPARSREVEAALGFLAPGWTLEGRLPRENPADTALMRAAATTFERFGMTLQGAAKRRIAEALGRIEDDVAGSEAGAANALIRRTLGPFRLSLPPGGAHVLRRQFDEERQPPGALHRLLVERFAEDYAAFRAAYADSDRAQDLSIAGRR